MGSDVFDSWYSSSNNITIYCEVESKPNRWNSNWDSGVEKVIWGYTGE